MALFTQQKPLTKEEKEKIREIQEFNSLLEDRNKVLSILLDTKKIGYIVGFVANTNLILYQSYANILIKKLEEDIIKKENRKLDIYKTLIKHNSGMLDIIKNRRPLVYNRNLKKYLTLYSSNLKELDRLFKKVNSDNLNSESWKKLVKLYKKFLKNEYELFYFFGQRTI